MQTHLLGATYSAMQVVPSTMEILPTAMTSRAMRLLQPNETLQCLHLLLEPPSGWLHRLLGATYGTMQVTSQSCYTRSRSYWPWVLQKLLQMSRVRA